MGSTTIVTAVSNAGVRCVREASRSASSKQPVAGSASSTRRLPASCSVSNECRWLGSIEAFRAQRGKGGSSTGRGRALSVRANVAKGGSLRRAPKDSSEEEGEVCITK